MGEDYMTPENEADIIMSMMNLRGFDMVKIGPGVLEFTDRVGSDVKRFRLTITEV